MTLWVETFGSNEGCIRVVATDGAAGFGLDHSSAAIRLLQVDGIRGKDNSDVFIGLKSRGSKWGVAEEQENVFNVLNV